MEREDELLQKLGLSEKEIAVYLTILQQKAILPTDVAKLTGINRSTVYAVAKELLRKGIIQEDVAHGSLLIALPPDHLLRILEEEQEQLNRRRHVTELAINALEHLTKDAVYAVPRMSFIDEAHFEKALYDASEKWSKSMMERDGIWHGFQDHTFVERFETWIDWYWQQPFAKNITLKTLTNDSLIERKIAEKQYERRHIKYWKQPSPFSASMWVIGDYIVSACTKVHPFYMIEIHDRMLADNLREVFKQQYSAA